MEVELFKLVLDSLIELLKAKKLEQMVQLLAVSSEVV